MPRKALPAGPSGAQTSRGRILVAVLVTVVVLLTVVVVAMTTTTGPAERPVADDSSSGAEPDGAVADGVYRIRTIHSARCLAADGADLVVGDCESALIRIADAGRGTARLMVPGEGGDGCVRAVEEVPTVAADCADADATVFRRHSTGELYRWESTDSGRCLAPEPDGSPAEVTSVTCDADMSSQYFALEPVAVPGQDQAVPSPPDAPAGADGDGEDDEDTDGDGDGDGGSSAGSLPASGSYRVATSAAGLCLGTGPEPGNEGRTVVIVDGCDRAGPPIWFERISGSTYQLSTYFAADDYTACIASDSPGTTPNGYLVAPYSCGQASLVDFVLEPSGDGFRVKVAGTGLCLAPYDGQLRQGQALSSAGCGGSGQVFRLS